MLARALPVKGSGASHIFFTLFHARTSCLRKSAADAYNKAKDTIKYLINAMLLSVLELMWAHVRKLQMLAKVLSVSLNSFSNLVLKRELCLAKYGFSAEMYRSQARRICCNCYRRRCVPPCARPLLLSRCRPPWENF